MAAKPWENRLMEKGHTDAADIHNPKECEVIQGVSDPCSVKIKKNNVTTRVSAKPPAMLFNHGSKNQSASSSEFRFDENTASSSSLCTSTPISGTILASEKTEESTKSRLSYMNLTESIRAKQKTCSTNRSRQSPGDSEYNKRGTLSHIELKGNASDPSLSSSKLSSATSWKDKSLTRNHGQGEISNERSSSLF